MQQLHLVGFTTDHRGLIFSVRRGAKSGGFVVQLDDPVINAVEELRDLIAEETEQADARASSKRPESTLSVREVQARLRRGRTIDQVARDAGVDSTWVARFAVPVLAEQAEIVRSARATRMTKQRVGLSGAPLGESVYRNLAERGLADQRAELEKAWRARQLTEGMWLVTITYTLRGRENEAVWEYDEAAGALRARGRLGTQLGFREPTRRAPRASSPSTSAKSGRKSTNAAKAKAPTTARRSSSRQVSKRVAAARRAAAARMMSEAEKATRRNAALARKAAKKPVVLPPLPPSAPPPRERLLVDEPLDAPTGWGDELDLAWDDAAPESDEFADEEDAAEEDVEVDEEEDVEENEEGAAEEDVEVEPEEEFVVVVESEPAPGRPARRRGEPLRARPVDASSPAERARRRVRVRPPDDGGDGPEGNGPVFRSDLAQPASEMPSFPRSPSGHSPEAPLSMPLRPIEPPPRRRRLRPLRGR